MKPTYILTALLAAGVPTAPSANSWEALVRGDTQKAAISQPSLSYRVLRQSIPDFLQQVARDADVQIDLSPGIAGMLSSLSVAGEIETVLDAVASQANLQWFAFNGTFYVSTAGEAEVRLLRLKSISSRAAIQAIEEVGLAAERFPIKVGATGKTIAFTGPPKLLALREGIIEGVEVEPPVVVPPDKPEQPAILVIPPPPRERGVTIFRNLSRTEGY